MDRSPWERPPGAIRGEWRPAFAAPLLTRGWTPDHVYIVFSLPMLVAAICNVRAPGHVGERRAPVTGRTLG